MVPSLAFAAWLVAIVAARVDGQGIVRWRGSGIAVGGLCPVRAVTGRRCPGCGMTRACLLLSHGQAVRATRMHPAVWLWVALLVRDSYRRYVAHIGSSATKPCSERGASDRGPECNVRISTKSACQEEPWVIDQPMTP
jgi:hypothetical protein